MESSQGSTSMEAEDHAGPSDIELVISDDMLNGIDEDPECQIIFTAVPYPLEQADMDQPVHCPPPEPSIVHDGKAWKERLVASMRRRGEIARAMQETNHIEYYSSSSTKHSRRRSHSNESSQLPPLTAPEFVVSKIVD
ncbi:unnamed protein product [Sphagnum tenellum]